MDYVFVSSWSHGSEKGGIRQYSFDSDSGKMELIRVICEDKSCAASIVCENRNILYVLNETPSLKTMRAGGGGEVLAYQLDRKTGNVEPICEKPTFCPNPAQFTLDKTGKYMVVAHHATSSFVTKIEQDENGRYFPRVLFDDSAVALFAINGDGTVGALLDIVKHTGGGPERKQTNAHPHSAMMSPSGNLFAVCDKGNDHVYMYRIDRENNKLTRCGEPMAVSPGYLPRYCVFHPSAPFFYHNNENSANINAYRYDENGRLTPIGGFNTLGGSADDCENRHHEQQGLCIDGTGRFLYSLHKEPNMVAVMRVDPNSGALKRVQNMPVDFSWPRGLTISPDGKFLIVTCLRGEKIVVLRVNEDGTVANTGYEYDQPCAAYATFWKA